MIDANGKIVREGKVASEPEALITWFGPLGVSLTRIWLEAGPLSQWLYAAMQTAGFSVELLETRHVRNAFKIMPVKTDRKDARGIAELMRLGWSVRCIADCNEALRLAPDDPGALDSRGFTYLELGRFAQAIADYDAVLARDPREPGSLYGRGLARLRSQSDPDAGRADLAAARALDPGIAEEFARYGLRE